MDEERFADVSYSTFGSNSSTSRLNENINSYQGGYNTKNLNEPLLRSQNEGNKEEDKKKGMNHFHFFVFLKKNII